MTQTACLKNHRLHIRSASVIGSVTRIRPACSMFDRYHAFYDFKAEFNFRHSGVWTVVDSGADDRLYALARMGNERGFKVASVMFKLGS